MFDLQIPDNKEFFFEQASFHEINSIVPNDKVLCYLCVSEWMHFVLPTLRPRLQQGFYSQTQTMLSAVINEETWKDFTVAIQCNRSLFYLLFGRGNGLKFFYLERNFH